MTQRERILAAIGWEQDPRRRRVLRQLLGEEAERAYLHAYSQTGHRARAVDQTRRALLGAARALEKIPGDLELGAWVFLRLEGALAEQADCPDPTRVLATSVSAPGRSEEEETRRRHVDAHPHCRTLLEGYRRYLARPGDEDLRTRAGWRMIAADLEGFLEGQFGDEDPAAAEGRVPFGQWLPWRGWRRSRTVAALVVLAVAVFAVLFWRAYDVPDEPRWSESSGLTEPLTPDPPIPSGPTPERIDQARVDLDGKDLVFQWEPVPGAARYSLFVMSARLDTLRTAEFVTGTQVRIARSEIPQLVAGGSYLFRVDAMKDGGRVASTGFTPFSVPAP